jgi:DNA-binding MurR/RpiR family transcriptional regulator
VQLVPETDNVRQLDPVQYQGILDRLQEAQDVVVFGLGLLIVLAGIVAVHAMGSR